MKKINLIIALVSIVFILSGCAEVAEEKKPIKIGVDVFPGWAHVFIAQEKGYFEKNGVDVDIVLNKDYLTVLDQFGNGELDGAFMVYADAIYANDQGIDVKVVYISDYSITGDVIAAKPEFKSLQDLKGKKISVESVNSFSHLFVLSVLEKNGIKEGDVFFENIGAQEVVATLERGDIAAGHTYGPGKTEAKEKGYVYLAYAGDVKGIITDTLVFHDKIIKERPDEIKAIVKSLFEAKKFQETNREEALQILAKAIGDTLESVSVGIDTVDYLDLEANARAMIGEEKEIGEGLSLIESGNIIVNFYLIRGQLSRIPDFDEIIESKFVGALRK